MTYIAHNYHIHLLPNEIGHQLMKAPQTTAISQLLSITNDRCMALRMVKARVLLRPKCFFFYVPSKTRPLFLRGHPSHVKVYPFADMSWQTQHLDLQKSVLYHLLSYVVVRGTYLKQCVKYNYLCNNDQ